MGLISRVSSRTYRRRIILCLIRLLPTPPDLRLTPRRSSTSESDGPHPAKKPLPQRPVKSAEPNDSTQSTKNEGDLRPPEPVKNTKAPRNLRKESFQAPFLSSSPADTEVNESFSRNNLNLDSFSSPDHSRSTVSHSDESTRNTSSLPPPSSTLPLPSQTESTTNTSAESNAHEGQNEGEIFQTKKAVYQASAERKEDQKA